MPAPRELMAEFRKVHQFNAFVTNGPVQYALAEYMQDENAYLSLAAFYWRLARHERLVYINHTGRGERLHSESAIAPDYPKECSCPRIICCR